MRIPFSAAAASTSLLAAPNAEPRHITRSGTMTGPRGQTAATRRAASRAPGQGASRNHSTTGKQGRGTSRTGTVSVSR